MLNLIKLFFPVTFNDKLKKIKILIFIKDFFKEKDENDKRRYWNGNVKLFCLIKTVKFLKNKVEIKKIDF